MRYAKHSLEYEVNLECLFEMENFVPMTLSERSALRSWAHSGHDVDSNPWNYFDSDGMQLNFLQAYRLEFGYSSGFWDSWRGPEIQSYFVDERDCFRKDYND